MRSTILWKSFETTIAVLPRAPLRLLCLPWQSPKRSCLHKVSSSSQIFSDVQRLLFSDVQMFRCSGALIFWCLDVQRLRCWEYDHVVQCSNVHKFIWSEVECSSVQMFRGSAVQRPPESAANISCHCKCQAFENFIWWRKMPARTSCKYFKQSSESCHVQGSLWLMQTWWNLQFGSFM